MEIRVLFLVSRENACGILSCLAAEDLVIMECCRGIQEFQSKLTRETYDLVIIDELTESMPDLELLRTIHRRQSLAEVVLIRAPSVVAVQRYLPGEEWCVLLNHPVSPADLHHEIRRIQGRKGMMPSDEREPPYIPKFLCGDHPLMMRLKRIISQAASSDLPILIHAELGAGKEMVANAIHCCSSRCQAPFVKVSCTVFDEDALERCLFGTEQGAFNGNVHYQKGRLELADQGTLFLDNVDDTGLVVQTKLMRLVEHKAFERIGGVQTLTTDARVVAATTNDLEEETRQSRFREDLFYRLNVFLIQVPPLRMRKSDIPQLVDLFIRKHCVLQNCPVVTPTKSFLEALHEHPWPGNVRELENVIERAIVMCSGKKLKVEHLPDGIKLPADRIKLTPAAIDDYPPVFKIARKQFEKEYLISALQKHHGNISHTADAIGITRRNLQIKIKQLNIEVKKLKKRQRSVHP